MGQSCCECNCNTQDSFKLHGFERAIKATEEVKQQSINKEEA
jgi:hypothetical protein